METCAKTLVSTHFSVILQSVECICWIGVHLPLYTLHGFTQYIIIIVLYLVCLLCFYFLDFLVLGAAGETRTVVTWNLWMRCFPACRLAFKRLVTAFAASSIKPALAKLLKKEVTYLGSQKRLSNILQLLETQSSCPNPNCTRCRKSQHFSNIYIYICVMNLSAFQWANDENLSPQLSLALPCLLCVLMLLMLLVTCHTNRLEC